MDNLSLYEITVGRADHPTIAGRTWITLAKDASEASTLVPDPKRILKVACKFQSVRAAGQSRVIGWYGRSVFRTTPPNLSAEHPLNQPQPTD